jgi:quercetin dioxygenase-like cupin family protein/CDGSH-type Zn-finger protein
MLETIKIGGEDTGGKYRLLEIEVRAGEGSPWHVHPDEDEWFYVLDGEFIFHVGDAELTLPAGGFAFGPKEVPHTFIAGPAGGRALVGFQPFLFEGFLREIGEPALIEGPARVVDADGNDYDLTDQTTIFLCRCGGSGTKPFCDGTHETLKYEAASRAPHTLAAIATAS